MVWFKHGLSRSPEYTCWRGIRHRCLNPRARVFKHYGGRGITVCERWLTFENFYADVGPRPSPAHSIDRYPDNDGNYEPGNVRWATITEQNLNTRRTKYVSRKERISVFEAGARTGLNENTVRARLRSGWTADRAVNAPAHKRVVLSKVDRRKIRLIKSQSQQSIADQFGISQSTVSAIRKG